MHKIIEILIIIILIAAIIPSTTGYRTPLDLEIPNVTPTKTFAEIGSIKNKVLTVDGPIGTIVVKYWEHKIDGIIIKGDHILLHLDQHNRNILKYESEWRPIRSSEVPLINDGFEPTEYFWKQKVCFLEEKDLSPFYSAYTKQDYPISCWEVRHHDGSTLLYDEKGITIGQGIPAPSEGFTVSGWVMQSDPDNYREFRENADDWFEQWTTSTVGLSLPTPSTISSHISDPDVEYFYVMAHGNQNFFQADLEGSYYYSSYLNNDMSQRDGVTFAFIGTCQSMISTGPGTFSYEFRKGGMADTATIGFDHMEVCPGWQYEYYWQNALFENMSKGLTIKESFDRATAQYPTIASAVIFLGDETLAIPQPELKGTGTITWTDIKPGETVTESFTIENDGDPDSVLCWEITEYPTWGSWQCTPSNGDALLPEDGPVTIDVSMIAPNEQDTSYEGNIKIVNIYNTDDECVIPVSLTTPKNKEYTIQFLGFLREIIQRYRNLNQTDLFS